MDIVWLGHSTFRLKGKQITIITDPFESTGPDDPWPRPTAQVVTISHSHPGHNNVKGVEGNPKIISGPGEYEVSGSFIVGFSTFHDTEEGKRLGRNTIFNAEIDGVRICHLGDLGHPLSAQQVEAMGSPDVLLVPIGGTSNLGVVAAAHTVRQLEPHIVIPMHFLSTAGAPIEPLDKFAHEIGLKLEPSIPRISVTRSNMPSDMRVVVLSPGK
ncbi:MAG: MBL fold metallo-hydrolase [Dehalococcoidia bacterium]|nr:MBL fold metallo-hydrolase [Dehalococcoidia bacterium]